MNPCVRLVGALALACGLVSLAAPSRVGAQPATLSFGACSPTQIFTSSPGLQCATLDVPFDRTNPALGDIGLAVQRVPASAPRTGVIVLLAGGPGQPALPAFESFLAPLAREGALRGFELVAFDQRGTGQSQELLCPPFGDSANGSTLPSLEGGYTAYVRDCGSALGPTRAYYTSQESVEDLNALRLALGDTPLSLFAVSYGTRVAGMYAREYPQGVARMVLDSLVPTTGPDVLGLARLHALRRVLDEGICGGGACRSFSSDVYAELTRLVAKLHRHPLHTQIFDRHGRLQPARITETGLLSLLQSIDLAPLTRELTPAAIAAAAHGDPAPLARLTYALEPEDKNGAVGPPPAEPPAGRESPPNVLGGNTYAGGKAPLIDSLDSNMLYAATYCVENALPWSPASPPSERPGVLHRWLASLPPGATAPFSLATAVATSPLEECLGWPATPAAPPSPTGVSAAPTLILSGNDDLRTPYEQALAAMTEYSDARLLRVPDVGHSTVSTDTTGCAKRAMIEFLSAGEAPPSCPGSTEPQALPLPPASLAYVRPAASRSPLAGQIATAAAITIQDLLGQTSFVGGLRGGFWTLNADGYELHGYTDVPGVALSGTIHIRAGSEVLPEITGRLRVRGRLSGRLTLRDRTLTGRIGGAPVRARLAAL